MVKRKLQRFAENRTFSNLFQVTDREKIQAGFPLKGRWKSEYFHNDNPIILELGCGKGEYTIYLSQKYPDRNFIGIDIKGARLWRGCKTATEENILNVAFIRTRIEFVDHFFGQGEVSEIWLTFPDPHSQKAKANKRLTSPMFLGRYKKILQPGGIIHLKTDNAAMHEYALGVIEAEGHQLLYATTDIYNSDREDDPAKIQTFYEKMFLSEGKPITYLKFKIK